MIEAAKALLGWVLESDDGLKARIVETEAYRTPDDPGCHAHRGMTKRNAVMFGPAGRAYVYFTYGNHWMLNVVAHEEADAAAILIRAAEPLEGLELMRRRRYLAQKLQSDHNLLSGPGKLCQAFGITGEDNGIDLFSGCARLRLRRDKNVTDTAVGTRIGLAQGMGDNIPWRFIDREAMIWASRPHL